MNRREDQANAEAMRADNLRRADALCLCRDQPANCMCRARQASAVRERVHYGMKQAAMVQAGLMQRTADAPEDFPCGYGERDALV